MIWNIEYGDSIEHFKSLEEEGEITPLTTRPMLTDQVDKWFYSAYINLKSLSGFEYQMTITDFNEYFKVYPIPFSKTTIISVIKAIEQKVSAFRDKKREAEQKAKSKNKR